MKNIINTLNALTNNNIDIESDIIFVLAYCLDFDETDNLAEWLDKNGTHIRQSYDDDEWNVDGVTIFVDWYGEDI